MEYGFTLPTRGSLATLEAMRAQVRQGEEAGFGLVGVSDHVVMPRDIRSRYPYSASGLFNPGAGEWLEQLTLLSYLAGQSSTIGLLTSVMVLPHRSPVVTAKMLATIDVLSGGRLLVGCGVGWLKEEFEALEAPPYEERGAVADEYIRAFRELWTSESPTFDGRYVRFSDVVFAPKPERKPHPPIWIGGESPAAVRRAARLGDGWYPHSGNPSHPLGTPEQVSEALGRLRHYTEEAGRDPAEIDIGYAASWAYDPGAGAPSSGQRTTLTGDAEQIAGDIRAFQQVGVRHLVLGFQRPTLDETLEHMERFMSEVAPLVGG